LDVVLIKLNKELWYEERGLCIRVIWSTRDNWNQTESVRRTLSMFDLQHRMESMWCNILLY